MSPLAQVLIPKIVLSIDVEESSFFAGRSLTLSAGYCENSQSNIALFRNDSG